MDSDVSQIIFMTFSYTSGAGGGIPETARTAEALTIGPWQSFVYTLTRHQHTHTHTHTHTYTYVHSGTVLLVYLVLLGYLPGFAWVDW